MSGLGGAQAGPAVWPHLSHVIRCLVAADPSAIWLSGLGVRGGGSIPSVVCGRWKAAELLCGATEGKTEKWEAVS